MQTRTIQIPATEAVTIQGWLDSDHLVAGTVGKEDTIKRFTVKFEENVEADIKVCNSEDGPFIDAVWFDEGCEIGFLDCRRTLLGEYIFIDKYDNAEYKVIVEEVA